MKLLRPTNGRRAVNDPAEWRTSTSTGQRAPGGNSSEGSAPSIFDEEKEFEEGRRQAENDFRQEGIQGVQRMAVILRRYKDMRAANRGYIRGYLVRAKALELGGLEW